MGSSENAINILWKTIYSRAVKQLSIHPIQYFSDQTTIQVNINKTIGATSL